MFSDNEFIRGECSILINSFEQVEVVLEYYESNFGFYHGGHSINKNNYEKFPYLYTDGQSIHGASSINKGKARKNPIIFDEWLSIIGLQDFNESDQSFSFLFT